LLAGNEKEAKKQHVRQSVSHPSSTAQSSQPPPRPSQTSQTLSGASDVSKQVDEALERQRAITGSLDEQITDVKAKITQQQLQQQGLIGARSSLRWNLVPDEHIISPRRSRHSGMSAQLIGTKGTRSPSRQTLPLLEPAVGGPVANFSGPDTTFTDPAQTVAFGIPQPSLTSTQILPPLEDTQYYPNFNAQGQQFSVPDTAAGGPLTPSMQAMPTSGTADAGTSPGFLGPRTSGQSQQQNTI